MGYIVDITIVLEVLFWLKMAQPQLPSLCEDDVVAAFEYYHRSTGHFEVHQQIRRYVDNMTLIDHINPEDNTHLKVERLINSHRRRLIDTITAGTKSDFTPTAAPPPQNLNVSQTPETQPNSVPSAPFKLDTMHQDDYRPWKKGRAIGRKVVYIGDRMMEIVSYVVMLDGQV